MSTHLQKELSSKVEKLSKEVEAKDRELAVKNLALVDARIESVEHVGKAFLCTFSSNVRKT